jgi:hypothetical protein
MHQRDDGGRRGVVRQQGERSRLSITFSCTINPGNRENSESVSKRCMDICFKISERIARDHDTPAARGNWMISVKTREATKVNLICFFYKRKLEEWIHNINENPEKWESKWRS